LSHDPRAQQSNLALGLDALEKERAVNNNPIGANAHSQRRTKEEEALCLREAEVDLALKVTAEKRQRRVNMTFLEIELAGDGRGIDAQALGVDIECGLRIGGQPAEEIRANLGTRGLFIRLGQVFRAGRVVNGGSGGCR
jgi:hypothetical protein